MDNSRSSDEEVTGTGAMLHNIRKLFHSGAHSDFTIECLDENAKPIEYKLHKSILRATHFFRLAIDNHTFLEARTDGIDMTESGDPPKAFRILLKHLYGYIYEPAGQSFLEHIDVYIVAQKYKMASLMRAAAEAAEAKLDRDIEKNRVHPNILENFQYAWTRTIDTLDDGTPDLLRTAIASIVSLHWNTIFGAEEGEAHAQKLEFFAACPRFVDCVTEHMSRAIRGFLQERRGAEREARDGAEGRPQGLVRKPLMLATRAAGVPPPTSGCGCSRSGPV